MKKPKAYVWQPIPTFNDTVETYAKYANHVVKKLCVNNFEEFVNSL